jgi:hypothetical protein
MRKQFNDVWIGSNGTGKTSLMIEACIYYMQYNPRKRWLWVLPDDAEEKLYEVEEIEVQDLETFTGIKKIFIDNEKLFDKFVEVFSRKDFKFHGCLACDDLGVIMRRRPEAILRLFRRRRQPNIEFIWSFHGLRTEVPPSFYTYVNSIILFRTSDNHRSTMDLLPDAKQEVFEEAYTRIQRITEINPHYHEEIVINPLDM